MCVYVPDVTAAIDTLAKQLPSVERSHQDSIAVVVGDFNQTHLSWALPNSGSEHS